MLLNMVFDEVDDPLNYIRIKNFSVASKQYCYNSAFNRWNKLKSGENY
jgi:hypothetical protein